MNQIQIVDYRAEHQPYFEKFNRVWIEELFEMEPVDEWVLTNPDKAILEPGGKILMALYDGVVAGTVGLRRVDDTVYEFTKMAVDIQFRRKGIAEALTYASFDAAKKLGASKVILYSNTKNAGAVKLYEKIGFRHVPVENDVYKRANVKMEIDILPVIRADVSHAAAIASIGKKSFRHAFEHLFESKETLFEYLEYTYDPLKLSKSIRKVNNLYFLVWYDGHPVGFAKVKKLSFNPHLASDIQMELQKIYVLPEYQGTGAGSLLMLAIKEAAREFSPEHIWLDTHVSNDKAIRFYERNGFRKIGRHQFLIGTQRFDYHVMALTMTSAGDGRSSLSNQITQQYQAVSQ